MVKEGIDLSYNSNDYLSQPLKDMLKGVLNHDGRTSIDQLLQAQDWNITTNNTLQDEIKDWNVASNSFLQDEIKDWNVASNSFLQDEIKDWNVASNSFLQDEIKDWNVASNSFLQDEIKDWNVASNSFLQDEIKDWNVASNSFLQDEIKDWNDAHQTAFYKTKSRTGMMHKQNSRRSVIILPQRNKDLLGRTNVTRTNYQRLDPISTAN